MRVTRMVTVACWTIAALALIGLAVWFLTGTVFGVSIGKVFSGLSLGVSLESLTGSYNVVGTYEIPSDSIDSVEINWIAGDVTVRPYDGKAIQLMEYAQRDLRDNEKLQFHTSGKRLTVEYRENGVRIRMPQKKLDVMIPRALCESLAAFTLDTTSADIDIENINAETLKASTVSGGLHLADATARKATMETTSGSIKVSGIVADDININTVSGSVRLNGAKTSALHCESTSGSLDLDGSFVKATLESVSGSVSLRSDTVPDKLKTDTTSGSVTVAVPNTGAVTVSHSSVSGKLSSDIPITMHGANAQFDFSTVSGSVKIKAID